MIPNRDGGEALAALVARLGEREPVIVVDDGSTDGSAERGGAAGARGDRQHPAAAAGRRPQHGSGGGRDE